MPLLRLGWNKQDPNYIATFAMDSTKCYIIDIRTSVEWNTGRGEGGDAWTLCSEVGVEWFA